MKKIFYYKTLLLIGCLSLTACDDDDGSVWAQGTSGINCWDSNEDGINDANEDVNGDGDWSVADCLITTPNPDESSALYGDGSAGDLNIPSGIAVDWVLNPPSAYPYNNQYQDCNIEALQLRVPDGTVIRCNGDFTANGIIVAPNAAAGGSEYPTNINGARWDSEVNGLPVLTAKETLYVKHNPQSGYRGFDQTEGRVVSNFTAQNGDSGGTVYIYAKGSIEIGDIIARGFSGVSDAAIGGGSGGLIVLVSGTSITQVGIIDANGGVGSDTEKDTVAVGGGGGGGIVHLLAPSITADTINVAGGRAGDCITGSGCTGIWQLGSYEFAGAGGAFGGHGGAGKSSTGNASNGTTATAGGEGKVFQFIGDPTTVLDVDRIIVH